MGYSLTSSSVCCHQPVRQPRKAWSCLAYARLSALSGSTAASSAPPAAVTTKRPAELHPHSRAPSAAWSRWRPPPPPRSRRRRRSPASPPKALGTQYPAAAAAAAAPTPPLPVSSLTSPASPHACPSARLLLSGCSPSTEAPVRPLLPASIRAPLQCRSIFGRMFPGGRCGHSSQLARAGRRRPPPRAGADATGARPGADGAPPNPPRPHFLGPALDPDPLAWNPFGPLLPEGGRISTSRL
jgi:hypothetical protein